MLVETAADVLHGMGDRLQIAHLGEKTGHFENEMVKDSRFLDHFPNRGARTMDQLVASTQRPVAELVAAVMRLTLAGRLEELPGHRFRRKGDG